MVRSALAAALFLLITGCEWGPRADARIIDTFDAATALLNRSAEAPAAVVPDAVLNRARCVIVVPAAVERATGAATCRDDAERWTMPWLVTFVPESHASADVLVFVLTAGAANQLIDSGLDLTGNRAARAGPIVQKMVTVTDVDLGSDAVSYVGNGSNLIAKKVAGKFSNDSHPPVGKEREFGAGLTAAVTSLFNTITPVGIIIHHSAVLPGNRTVTTDVREIDTFHQERGFNIRCQGHEYHVAYHYLVLPDGTVKQGRPERCEGAHARGYNEYLGIAVVGDFSSVDNATGAKGQTAPTPQQLQAVTELCRRLMTKYDIPLQRVLRHSDVGTTRCPGDRFPYAALLRALQGTA